MIVAHWKLAKGHASHALAFSSFRIILVQRAQYGWVLYDSSQNQLKAIIDGGYMRQR